jgi:hypothetical protein
LRKQSRERDLSGGRLLPSCNPGDNMNQGLIHFTSFRRKARNSVADVITLAEFSVLVDLAGEESHLADCTEQSRFPVPPASGARPLQGVSTTTSIHSVPQRLAALRRRDESRGATSPAKKDLAHDVERKLDEHQVGKLLMTIEGVRPLTAGCLIAEPGDPARFPSAGAIASYVGVIPRVRQSGKKRFAKGPAIPLGNARLRKALWMVVLQLVRRNPWLRQYYERLRAAGKPGKVAVIAAMRKLLVAVWSVATHRKPFVPILPAIANANDA